jgi:hypothetical protein
MAIFHFSTLSNSFSNRRNLPRPHQNLIEICSGSCRDLTRPTRNLIKTYSGFRWDSARNWLGPAWDLAGTWLWLAQDPSGTRLENIFGRKHFPWKWFNRKHFLVFGKYQKLGGSWSGPRRLKMFTIETIFLENIFRHLGCTQNHIKQ